MYSKKQQMPDKCPQCIAKTAKGEQCKRMTCKFTPYCFSHKAYRIDTSTIPGAGRGGFAARPLKRGDTIANFTTATLKQSPAEFKASYPDKKNKPTHSARVGQFYYTAMGNNDVRQNNAVGLINRASAGARNNARILGSGRVVSTRRIPENEEVFLAYGSSYRI
jgi:hypothetical protein